ncbi:Nitroreductase family [Novymonas esmeraldas]|uniref:Nitroreductase family n=1 Tax=Novymonas esmeraldas TaxID=1808958 RepID=A0AAW0EKE3_9TRYP
MHCFSKKSTAAKEGNGAQPHAGAGAGASSSKKDPIKSSNHFIEAISKRRSIYSINNKLPKSNKEITKIVKDTIRQCPSSFNVQSSRAVILFGAEHAKVWDVVKAALKKVTSEEQYAQSEIKVNNCFAVGAGTILFYEDRTAISGQQEQFPTYAANFPVWSQHSSAIAQFAVWSALAQDGIGATLQHYNELIEADLRPVFDIPDDWQLVAQMPFGGVAKPADAKTFIPDDTRFQVYGQ